jgi:hypothetical protein
VAKFHLPAATHEGWYGICPGYASGVDTEAPCVWARWWFLDPLFWVADKLEAVRVWWETMLDPTMEPMFRFRLKPIAKETEG